MNPTDHSKLAQSSSWNNIVIDEKQFFIRSVDHDGGWKIFLTDMRDIWFEELGRREILRKCERLNPTLSTEDIDVVQFVGRLFSDVEKNAVKKSVELIEFAGDLDGGIFKFSIDFTKGNSRTFWEEVTMPLCSVARELQRRHTILLNLVRNKDEEIAEYILNGAELTRKHIKTEPFHKDLFKKNPPDCNNGSTLDAFKPLMILCGDNAFFYKTESTCLPNESSEHSKSTIICGSMESEVNTREDVILAVKKEENVKTASTESDCVQEPCTLLPKCEPEHLLKLRKNVNNTDTSGDKETKPKKARGAPYLRGKRLKKTIHDFIS